MTCPSCPSELAPRLIDRDVLFGDYITCSEHKTAALAVGHHLPLVPLQPGVHVVLQQPPVTVQPPHEHVGRRVDRVGEHPGRQGERVVEAEGHVRDASLVSLPCRAGPCRVRARSERKEGLWRSCTVLSAILFWTTTILSYVQDLLTRSPHRPAADSFIDAFIHQSSDDSLCRTGLRHASQQIQAQQAKYVVYHTS